MRQPSTVEIKEKYQQHPQLPITQPCVLILPVSLNTWTKAEFGEGVLGKVVSTGSP